MYATASLPRVIFSASSSGISMPTSSSNAITSSTVSSESAPRSSTNEASAVTSSSSTPSCSTMMLFTLSETAIQSSDSVGGWWLVVRGVGSPAITIHHPPSELHVHAAVDGQHLTCNIRCLVGREKAHRRCHVLRRSQALQGNHRDPIRLSLLRDHLRHVRVHEARGHDVHRNIPGRHFPRERLAEADQARLGRRVVGLS